MPEKDNSHTWDKASALPTSLNASDIADYLGISLSTAYKLVKSKGFPVVKLPGIRRVVISRDKFLEWYAQTGVEDISSE